VSGRSWIRSPTASYKRRYKMVPDASLLGAQHIRIGLASLSSLNSIWNERSRVILVGITCFAIDHKQISLNQIHVHLFLLTQPTLIVGPTLNFFGVRRVKIKYLVRERYILTCILSLLLYVVIFYMYMRC